MSAPTPTPASTIGVSTTAALMRAPPTTMVRLSVVRGQWGREGENGREGREGGENISRREGKNRGKGRGEHLKKRGGE